VGEDGDAGVVAAVGAVEEGANAGAQRTFCWPSFGDRLELC
jgi:hypothetical protein